MAPTAKSDGKPSGDKPAKGKVEKSKTENKPTPAAKQTAAKTAAKDAKQATTTKPVAKDAKKPAPAAKKETTAKPAPTKEAPAAKIAVPAKVAAVAKPVATPAPAKEEKPKAVEKPKSAAKPAAAKPKKAATAASASKGRVVKKTPLRGKGLKKKKVNLRFGIDCTNIVEDNIMDVADFEKYLKSRIKVNGKTNNLGNNVSLERQKMKVLVNSDVHFSKQYLKYLTKKYLKKNSLRDWIRVVANDKDSYELRYFRISSNDDDEEDAE